MEQSAKQLKANKASQDSHKPVKSTPILILPHPPSDQVPLFRRQVEPATSTSNNCATKLSVHYIVSLNNEVSLFASNNNHNNNNNNNQKNVESDTNNYHKIDVADGERKCLISLQPENASSTECDGNSLKPNHSTSQRLLISPTDFLTLSEEGSSHRNPEVRRDVNLSASSFGMPTKRNVVESNYAICLDRYCESPLMLDSHKDSQLICDDEASCTGRNSRLSETPEDINTDDLFASTFGTDQHSSLREVDTPVDGESSRNTPILVNKELTKSKIIEETTLIESNSQMPIESNDSKPILTVLDPLEAETNSCSQNNSFTIMSSETGSSTPVSTSASQTAMPLVDVKVVPAGLLAKDSVLLANLAAALPSSFTSKQIAIQVIREDGTSIVLPLATAKNDQMSQKDTNNDLNANSSMVLTKVVSPNETIRPFKCELCNSTFTRLGNYTRHKKIHSFPSKVSEIIADSQLTVLSPAQEDQRFRCEICSKSFIQRCDLARHLHIHRGTEPHRCPQCGKGYIRHSDLVTHQRFHNKEKPFACPHCSKGFCQRGDLNRHLRSIHLQLKPILCGHCHKKFAKEETLLRHINATHRDMVNDTQVK